MVSSCATNNPVELHNGGPLCQLVMNSDFAVNGNKLRRSKVYLSLNGVTPSEGSFRVLAMDQYTRLDAVCPASGHLNILSIMRFIKAIQHEVVQDISQSILCRTESTPGDLTNALFLLGSYMILAYDDDPVNVWNSFVGNLGEQTVANPLSGSDGLTMIDYWHALQRARENGWFRMPAASCPGWDRWGAIFSDDYVHFNNPFHGSLHEVIPGKIVAFKAPKNLGGIKATEKVSACRDFSPEYYADVFRVLGVSSVVRLNDAEYNKAVFTSSGIKHVDMCFEDYLAPPRDVLSKFFKMVDGQDSIVAVHCDDVLARTGTLIALYMMRSHGFTARQAAAWLRIMRPGSVPGPALQFLCGIESRARHPSESPQLAPASPPPPKDALQALSSAMRSRTPSPDRPPPSFQPNTKLQSPHDPSLQRGPTPSPPSPMSHASRTPSPDRAPPRFEPAASPKLQSSAGMILQRLQRAPSLPHPTRTAQASRTPSPDRALPRFPPPTRPDSSRTPSPDRAPPSTPPRRPSRSQSDLGPLAGVGDEVRLARSESAPAGPAAPLQRRTDSRVTAADGAAAAAAGASSLAAAAAAAAAVADVSSESDEDGPAPAGRTQSPQGGRRAAATRGGETMRCFETSAEKAASVLPWSARRRSSISAVCSGIALGEAPILTLF